MIGITIHDFRRNHRLKVFPVARSVVILRHCTYNHTFKFVHFCVLLDDVQRTMQ